MDTYFKILAGVLLASVLGMILHKQTGETGILLTILVCCGVICGAVRFLEPVLEFWEQLQDLGKFSHIWLEILIKVVGIGMISEIASLICTDSGNGSLGKTVQILSSAVILWLSIPLFQELMDLIGEILGDL